MQHYRRIAEESGRRWLRESEALSALVARAQQAEHALQAANDDLERRVEERTAELTAANAHLSRVITERERAQSALRTSEEAFRSFMGHFPGLACIKEADTTWIYANEGFRSYLGLDPDALTGVTNAEIFPERTASEMTQDDLRVLSTGRTERIEREFGGRSWVTQRFLIPRSDGAPRLGGLALDVTDVRRNEEERRKLEQQMEQSQRLESLGVLAGGIAHDFNNLLTAILANINLLRATAPPDAPGAACLSDAESAARAAAGLCQQMLTYSGRAPFAAELLDLGALVGDMAQLLRSSVSRRLGLDARLAEGLPLVEGDRSQLQQVVMNLVINAAESMGEGDGTVTVTTSVVAAGPERLRAALLGEGLPAGRYVCLEVADMGCGMDLATQRRIFEPFFTSKFAGRGLGLSAVLGIVRKSGGAIEMESAPGRGSRFRMLLPIAGAAVASGAGPRAAGEWTGSGRVLVVDDDPLVRRAAARVLRRLGFEVLEAPGGAEGIELYERNAGKIRAVILDLTMPHLDGVETLRGLRAVDPGARVLVASGHAGEEVRARFQDVQPDRILQKPYDLDVLRENLRAVLAGCAAPAR